jgi:transposase-like protein
MGRKAKYTYEQKLKACKEYLSGKRSASELAKDLSMGKRGYEIIRRWVKVYQAHGPDALNPADKNSSYSKEFKMKVVEEYLAGEGSIVDLMAKYGIRAVNQIQSWISKYNSYEELKDYDPHPEVYVTMAKKTTLEERKDIVLYCLENNKDYKGTALKYGCSYSQIYSWVRYYEESGEDGLKDNRGKRKQEEELSDLEIAQRRIKQLEHELLLKERENELLKKAEEFERRWLTDYQKSDGSQ